MEESRRARGNGWSDNGYDALDRAELRFLADSLIDEPNVPELIRRLGYDSEKQLCAAEGCHDLIDYFYRNNFFDNFQHVQETLRRGRVGYY